MARLLIKNKKKTSKKLSSTIAAESSSSRQNHHHGQKRSSSSSCSSIRHGFLFGILLVSLVMMFVLQDAATNRNQHQQLAPKAEQEISLAAFKKKRDKDGRSGGSGFLGNKRPTTAGNNIWEEDNINLPQWLKDYFTWHKQQRAKLIREWKPKFTPSSQLAKNQTLAAKFLWQQNDYRFFVARCFAFDRKCGGLADRLLPLPYLLQVAANSSRLLLIHYEKPAPLQSFLVPPQGGIDWRIPSWLLPAFNFTPSSRRYKATQFLEWHANHFPDTIVQSIFQAFHYGSIPYNARRDAAKGEPTFKEVVRDVWRVLFTPTAPIQKIIQKHLTALQLQEAKYTSIHIRALYAISEHQRSLEDIQQWTQNAINCATQLDSHLILQYGGQQQHLQQGPYYLASDSNQAAKVAIDYGKHIQQQSLSQQQQQQQQQTTSTTMGIVRTRSMITTSGGEDLLNNNKTPYHFDRIPEHLTNNQQAPEDYYDTYVDLMLLAMGRCVTYGVGGYGKLASWLSFNNSCASLHYKKKMIKCSLSLVHQQKPPQSHTTTTNHHRSLLPSLLAPPMMPAKEEEEEGVHNT